MKNNQAQHLSAGGSCTREKDMSDTWWNLRKTECCMNRKFSGLTTVLLALLGKCKAPSPGTQGPGPHHACKSVRVEENVHASMHTCRDTKAEHTNQWMSNGMGRVRLADSYERFLSSRTIFVPFLQFEVISKWKVEVQWLLASGYWYLPHCEGNEWILLSGCFVWLITIKIMITSTQVTWLTTACNFNPRVAGTTGLHRHLHLWAHTHVQGHTSAQFKIIQLILQK